MTDDVDGRRRLRDAFGHLLQVHQLCVLVGSGASYHLGSPRIRAVDADLVLGMADRDGLEVSADVRSLIKSLVSAETDLEAFLGRVVAARSYAHAFDLKMVEVTGTKCKIEDLDSLFHAVNRGLAWACDLPRQDPPLEAPFDEDPLLAHREFFRRLLAARRPEAPRVRVFTTNYDTVIERSLDEAGIQYFDGFVGSVRRRIELASYEQDLYTAPEGGAGSLRRVHDVVHLYKMHGSLTWRVETTAALGTTTVVQSDGPPTGAEVAVIYPTPTKEADVLGHPYSDFLRSFSTALIQPECVLLSLGYGFADEHINRIIFDALSHNASLQLFVADPNSVVDDLKAATPGEPIERSDSPVGRLSNVQDPRISVLTGSNARFTELADLLPDVSEMTDREREELKEALASALLSPAEPDPPVDQ
ncbi:MAG: SIR2 family protein [Acidimicrobiia bacterium]|nr:SIR2 family protein [Acidimicrobiia bacterium]